MFHPLLVESVFVTSGDKVADEDTDFLVSIPISRVSLCNKIGGNRNDIDQKFQSSISRVSLCNEGDVGGHGEPC